MEDVSDFDFIDLEISWVKADGRTLVFRWSDDGTEVISEERTDMDLIAGPLYYKTKRPKMRQYLSVALVDDNGTEYEYDVKQNTQDSIKYLFEVL